VKNKCVDGRYRDSQGLGEHVVQQSGDGCTVLPPDIHPVNAEEIKVMTVVFREYKRHDYIAISRSLLASGKSQGSSQTIRIRYIGVHGWLF
jgi:hypothetical protein